MAWYEKMKSRLFFLTTLMLALFCMEQASAQGEPKKAALKTRYIYLWDVTGSTKSKKAGDAQFRKISEFLVRDIASKPQGSVITVIPFNDFVIEGEIVEVTASTNMDSLINKGDRLVMQHNTDYNKNSGRVSGIGYTNIASAIYYAADKYIDSQWNTSIVLLTDGSQEYYSETEHLTSRSKEDTKKADDYLLAALKYLKEKIERTDSFNRLYYVVTTDKPKDNPRNLDKTGEITDCDEIKCIVASQGSINVYTSEISVALAQTEISARDNKFTIKIEGLPEEIKELAEFKVEVSELNRSVTKSIDSHNRITIDNCSFSNVIKDQESASFDIQVTLGKSDFEVGNSFYCIQLNNEVLSQKIVNKFAPRITVKRR